MKKHIILIAIISLLLLMLPLMAGAEIVYSGSCGTNDVSYTLDNEGLLTISGNGYITSRPWGDDYQITSQIKVVIINNGVKNIMINAFYGADNLTDITIPNSVTIIDESAFSHCTSLINISIPNSVTSLGQKCFLGCSSLKSLVIPDSVTDIGHAAFSSCSSLEHIVLSNGLTEVGGFYRCSSLNNVTIPDNVEVIHYDAFKECTSLQFITIPEKVNFIGGNAFANCFALKEVNIKGMPSIGIDVFENCYELSNISLLSCASIAIQQLKDNGYQHALNITPHFQLSKVEKVEPTCTDTGTEAYWTCSLCGKMFRDEAGQNGINEPIVIPAYGHVLSINGEIAPSCTEIGTEAYWSCDVCGKLFSDEAGTIEITAPIDIPALGHAWNKPTYIWSDDYKQVTASRICKNDCTHEETEIVNTTSKKKAATYTKAGRITYTAEFENSAFKKQTRKVTISKLPVDIKQDGNKYHLDPQKKTATFTGTEKKTVTKLIIPDTIKDNGKTFKITEIAAKACKGLSKLKSVSIGKNIKTIGVKAFYNCKKLAHISVRTAKLTDKTVGSNAFGNIYKKVVFKCPKSKLKIYKKLFSVKGAPNKASFE